MCSGNRWISSRPLHVKLVLLSSSVIITGFLFLYGFSSFLLHTSLQNDISEELQFRLLENWAVYETGGIEFLEKELALKRGILGAEPFFLRIIDNENTILYKAVPQDWKVFDLDGVEQEAQTSGNISFLSSEERSYRIATMTVVLEDGSRLQAGVSTEEYHAFIRRFSRVFALTFIPLTIIAIGASLFITSRLLKPLKQLLDTVQSIIHTGEMKIRVPVTDSGDELDTLGKLFNSMLERIDMLITNMRDTLDNVAHDLRTPVTRLRLSAETVLQAPRETADFRKALTEFAAQAADLQEMLNAILDIQEAQSGVIKLKKEPLFLDRLIEDLIELHTYVAEEKSITIESTLPGNVEIAVDKNRFRQVVSNLLDNAIKYSPEGGRIEIRMDEYDDRVEVKVGDNGIGIDEPELGYIWNRFYRSKKNNTQHGFGLGLTLVKAIVEAHGGRISVRSSLNSGSEFTVTLYRKA